MALTLSQAAYRFKLGRNRTLPRTQSRTRRPVQFAKHPRHSGLVSTSSPILGSVLSRVFARQSKTRRLAAQPCLTSEFPLGQAASESSNSAASPPDHTPRLPRRRIRHFNLKGWVKSRKDPSVSWTRVPITVGR